MTGVCYVTVGNTNGRRQVDGRVEDEGKMAMLLGEECKSGERSERQGGWVHYGESEKVVAEAEGTGLTDQLQLPKLKSFQAVLQVRNDKLLHAHL